jgi:hypothetical protein
MAGETITRLRPVTTTDPYSQEQRVDWDQPPAQQDVEGCTVYLASTGETLDVGRDQATETLTVLLPSGADIDPADRVIIRGNTYDVQGFPFDWIHPMTGWSPGAQITVTRRRG